MNDNAIHNLKIPAKRANLNITLMVTGRMISELGTAIFSFAISLYVLNVTKSAALFTFILSFSILPNVISNIIGGVVVDRFNKKALMVGSDFANGFIVLSFMFILKVFPTNIILLAVLNMLISMLQNLFSLAMTSSTANLVNENQVSKLASIFTGFGSAISISGYFLGAIVYQHFSMTTIFLFNGISFIIAALLEAFLIFYNSQPMKNANINFISDYKAVLHYMKDKSHVRLLFIIECFMVFIFAAIGSVVAIYVSYNVIKVSKLQLAFIQGSLSVGTLIASFIITLIPSVNKLLKRLFSLLHMQSVGILCLCIPALFVAFDSSKWTSTLVLSLFFMFLGFISVVRSIPISAYFQTYVDEDIRGRFFAAVNTFNSFLSVISIWLYGLLLDKMVWYAVLISVAAFSTVVIVALQVWEHKNKVFANVTISENESNAVSVEAES